jgi:hypothetical protein
MTQRLPIIALLVVISIALSARYLLPGLGGHLTEEQVIHFLNQYCDDGCLSTQAFWMEGDFPNSSEVEAKMSWEQGLEKLFPTAFRYAQEVLYTRHGLAINRIQVNQHYDASCINIYVVKCDKHRLLSRLDVIDNAAYLGFGNIIVCDDKFVQSMLMQETFEDHDGKAFAPIAWYHKRVLILFILLHEIGHIANGNTDLTCSAYHPNIQPDGPTETPFMKAENEADDFAIELLKEQTKDDAVGWVTPHFLLLTIHNQLEVLSEKHFGKGIDALIVSGERLTIRATSKTHPPMFVRLVSIAERLRARKQEFQLVNAYWDYSPILSRLTIRVD